MISENRATISSVVKNKQESYSDRQEMEKKSKKQQPNRYVEASSLGIALPEKRQYFARG